MQTLGPSYVEPDAYSPVPIELVYPSQPAAGSGLDLDNPFPEGSRLLAVTFKFVTLANVADRTVSVDYEDGRGLVYARNGFGSVQQANTTGLFSFTANRGTADWNTGGQVYAPLLPVILERGHALQVNIANVQVDDQLSNIVLAYERLPFSPG